MAENQIEISTETEESPSSKKAVISKIEQTIDDNTIFAPFGVDDENVKIFVLDSSNKLQEWGSLRDFFAEWQAFKTAWSDFMGTGNFLQTQKAEPSNSVKLWFADQTPTSNG